YYFAWMRDLSFDNAVSPLRPPMLATIAAIVVFLEFVGSQAFIQERPIYRYNDQKALFLNLSARSFQSLRLPELENEIVHSIARPFFTRGYFWFVMVASILLAIGYLIRSQAPIDGYYFEVSFTLFAMFVYFFLFMVFGRMIAVWL